MQAAAPTFLKQPQPPFIFQSNNFTRQFISLAFSIFCHKSLQKVKEENKMATKHKQACVRVSY